MTQPSEKEPGLEKTWS